MLLCFDSKANGTLLKKHNLIPFMHQNCT